MVAELVLSLSLFLTHTHTLFPAGSGFRGNITRKWWLACECRYHFLARYQPALPVITAPPGLRHGLLDKPPTAKVYCLFHLPSPFYRSSFPLPPPPPPPSSSCAPFLTLPLLLFRATAPLLSSPLSRATSDTRQTSIELFENRPKRREITRENGYVVRSFVPSFSSSGRYSRKGLNYPSIHPSIRPSTTCWREEYATSPSSLSSFLSIGAKNRRGQSFSLSLFLARRISWSRDRKRSTKHVLGPT